MRKQLFYPLLFCAVLCGLFCACSKDDDKEDVNGGGGSVSKTDLEVQAAPTDWIPIGDNIDLQSTMTADVAIDLSNLGLTYEYDKDDLMAAFINGTCRAVASPFVDEADSTVMFALTIKKLEDESTGGDVTLRFYSAKLRHIFTMANTFPYGAESRYGSVQNPVKPIWTK